MASQEFDRLIAALFDGVTETPPWSSFLQQLRQATGADFAGIVVRPPGPSWSEAIHAESGELAQEQIETQLLEMPDPADMPWRIEYTEGRPYALDAVARQSNRHDDQVYREAVERFGLAGIVHMRIREPTGVDAWLTITRSRERFSKADSKLLEALAPMLRGVLQLFVALERERFAASMTAEAVRRLQFGWIALDAAGQILDLDHQATIVLSGPGPLGRSPSGRLVGRHPELDREIATALSHVAHSRQSRPRAITLSQDPWLDMLLVPARHRKNSTGPIPAAIAYIHGDSWRSADRCEQLAELFDLSPREAKMALALCRGMTITEAAAEFNITVGSARMYSKAIYAKTGARGLPDMIRIVMRSVLAIA